MRRYVCPYCQLELTCECHADMEPYFADDGEDIYCSVCQYTAPERIFQGAANVQEKKAKLRAQVEANLSDDHPLEWT